MQEKEDLEKRITFLHYLNFPINMAYAIQNVWITALMINFNTPDLVDSFIWIIPNILTILIRPYFIRFVHKNRTLFLIQYSLCLFFFILGGLGCVFVAISVIPKIKVLRIVICTIGWTFMDAGFELCEFMSEKFKERIKKQCKDIQVQDEISQKLSFYGQLAGYIVSFFICVMNKNKKLKNFRNNCAYSYLVCAILVALNVLACSDKKAIKIILKMKVKYEEIVNIIKQPGFYFSGFYQLKAANINDKFYIFIRFLSLFIVDAVLIYGTMWFIYGFQESGQKQSYSYHKGMQYGSILLLGYTMVSYYKVKNASQFMFFSLLIGIGLTCTLTFYLKSFFIGPIILAIGAGVNSSIFSEYIQPKWEEQNFVFEGTKEITDRIEKIFILCPMPFISMIMLKRDDVCDCLIWVTFLVGVAILLFMVKGINFKSVGNRTSKINKVE